MERSACGSAQDQPRRTWRVLRTLPLFPQGSHAGWGGWRALQARVKELLVVNPACIRPTIFTAKAGSISRLEFISNIFGPLGFLILLAHGRSALIFRTFSKAGLNLFSSSILSETTTQNELCQYLHLPSLFPMHCLLILVFVILARACLLCLSLSLLPGLVVVFCCIYSNVVVHLFLDTVGTHSLYFSVHPLPLTSRSRRSSLIQCFFIAHLRPSTVFITVSSRLHI